MDLVSTDLTTEEGPWTVAAGELARKQIPFRPDGVETLTYDNVFGQFVDQVWFDGKVATSRTWARWTSIRIR